MPLWAVIAYFSVVAMLVLGLLALHAYRTEPATRDPPPSPRGESGRTSSHLASAEDGPAAASEE